MGLFGGSKSATSTSKTTRPGYVSDMINGLNDQYNKTTLGEYTPEQYAGLNSDQQNALSQLMNDSQLHDYATQLLGQGAEGQTNVNNAYNQLLSLYQEGEPTAQQIQATANQFYDYTGTNNLINQQNQALEQRAATETNPEIAQQTMQSGYNGGLGGFGSSQRLMKDRAAAALATNEQNSASDISNAAYTNAQNQAQALLSGNRQNKINILGALATNGQNQLGMANTAAQLSQTGYENANSAIAQQQGNLQNQYNNDYTNAQNKANWGTYGIQQQLGAVEGLNSAYGQTQKTTTSGGGGSMLGGVLSAAGGIVGGIYGGPAGAALGSQLGGIAGSALAS